MSNEGVNNNQNSSNLLMYGMMPSVTLGVSATHGIVKARGVSNALKLQNHSGFKKLSNSLDCDVFTKSIKIAEEYEKHKGLVKEYTKNRNKLVKIAKKNGIASDVIKNSTTEDLIKLVKKTNLDDNAKTVLKSADEATSALRNMDKSLDSITDVASSAIKAGSKAAQTGFVENAKKLFKNEITIGKKVNGKFKFNMSGTFNLAMTALTFIPNVINRVIPAFKEDGFISGIKETGKVLIQGTTDFFSYALGGAVGRTIGGAIGSIFPGVGTLVGATLGDMIGSMFIGGKTTKIVDKAIGADEETEEKLKAQREQKKLNQQFGLNVAQNPYLRAQVQANARKNLNFNA